MNRFLRPISVLVLACGGPLLSLPTYIQPALAAQTPQADQIEGQRRSQQSLSPPPWQLGPTQAPASDWHVVMDEAELEPEFKAIPVPIKKSLAGNSEQSVSIQKPWTYGFGGGVRFGAGEPTNAVITGRIAYNANESIAVSLRPSYIFGNRDLQGVDNNQGSFEMPLTLDLFPRSAVSPYLGAGIATNTDSSGSVNPMISGGLDINLTSYLAVGLNLNYIFQNQLDDADTDWEAMTLIYLKF